MIFHVVLLQPKPETSAEEMAQVLEQVKTLQKSVPGILEVQAGENLGVKHPGYTYGFIMRFLDKEHLDAYAAPHPAHQVVSKEIRRTCSSVIDFDLPQQ